MSEQNFISRFFPGIFSRNNGNTNQFTQPIDTRNQADFRYNLFGLDDEYKNRQFISIENNEFELFDTTPELQIVTTKGASLLANGRWQVRKYSDDSIIEEHPLIKLLERPNAFQTRNEFLTDIYINKALYGNSFTYMNYALAGISQYPTSLVNLITPRVAVQKTGKVKDQTKLEGVVRSFDVMDIRDRDKVIDSFKPNEIIHLKNFNPNDPIIGLSPLRAIHMPLTIIRSARGYVDADYRKKGALGVLSGASNDAAGALPLNKNDRSDLERQVSEHEYGTADQQKKLIISNSPVSWSSFSSAIKDHVIHESLELEFKKIIDCYGLNEALFSFLKQSTFSNQSNGEKQAYDNAIKPFAESLSYAFTDAMKLPDQGIYLQLDFSHVAALQENEKEKAETTKLKVDAFRSLVDGGVSAEEARRLVGLE